MSDNNKNTKSSEQQKRRAGISIGPMPMGPADKPKNAGKTFKRLAGELKPFRFRLLMVLILTILSTAASIYVPKLFAKGINQLVNGFLGDYLEYEFILKIIIASIVLYVLSAFLQGAIGFLMAGIGQRTVYRMRKEVSEKLTRLPLKYYDAHPHGETLSRITNDLDTISNTLAQSLSQLISGLLTVIGITAMMLSINVWMSLIVIASVPFTVLLMMVVMKASQKHFSGNQKYVGNLNGHVEEMYSGHIVVKAFGHEKAASEEFAKINDKLYKAGWKSMFFSGLMFPIMDLVSNIFYVIICVVGMIFVARGSYGLNVGEVTAFIQYAGNFQQPFMQLSRIMSVIQSAIAASERVFEIMDEPEQIPDSTTPLLLNDPQGKVAFKNVRFGYSDEKILMTDISFDVKPGQIVAIVGPTGAGKTTIVNLLMRFYETMDGSIEIDGIPTKELTRTNLRQNIGMVLQDTWLFDGTVADNIAYGRPGATQEEIQNAAWAAQAHRFIKTLPEGYNTVLKDDGSNISQGQRQLITIARALLTDPPIMILDEATSSVDTITEMHIQSAMTELMKGRTSFVIAHRLSTIKNADMILVMNNGDIIEKGSHNELMDKKGFYHDLYNSQFEGAAQ